MWGMLAKENIIGYWNQVEWEVHCKNYLTESSDNPME